MNGKNKRKGRENQISRPFCIFCSGQPLLLAAAHALKKNHQL